jgi:hypothetical protein
MTLRPFIVVALVLAIAGCARMAPPIDPRSPRATGVNVVDNRFLVVDQEPIIVRGSSVVVMWRLDADSAYRFPERNAIVFTKAPEGEFRCNTTGNGRQVECTDRGTPGEYKYTITVTRGSDTLKLDPFLYNL